MIQEGQQALKQERTLEWPRDRGIMFLAPWETVRQRRDSRSSMPSDLF